MATKLGKSDYPNGSSPNDFECFGPPATKDGEFSNVKIADLGCFTQDNKDTNKYYHAAVVRHRSTQKWYAYFEWGRTGATNPQFQFVECNSESEAQKEFADQLHAKNDKRGQWTVHASLGRILQAKPGKDCYLVRPQATRSTGLPDARTIKFNEGASVPVSTSKVKTKSIVKCDSQTLKLMQDLNVGTIKYTKGSMVNDSLPTQAAIDEARDILGAANKCVLRVGDHIDDQINDTELKNLTGMIYSRIPKKKNRNDPPETWLLSKNNIVSWQQDLDAYESALYASGTIEDSQTDPFGGMKLTMEWISPQSDLGEFVYNWAPKATRNRHGYIGAMKVRNVWKIERHGDQQKFFASQAQICKDKWTCKEKVLHQPQRSDVSKDDLKRYVGSNTALLFHGTRSVNVSGLLRDSFRMPKELVGVVVTGAMFSGGGGGIYFADDWKKSAGYTSLSSSLYAGGGGSIPGRGAFMYLCDVALGNLFVAPGPHPYVGPPRNYHTVFGKAGDSGVQNNEYIIFDKPRQQMRYLVEFTT